MNSVSNNRAGGQSPGTSPVIKSRNASRRLAGRSGVVAVGLLAAAIATPASATSPPSGAHRGSGPPVVAATSMSVSGLAASTVRSTRAGRLTRAVLGSDRSVSHPGETVRLVGQIVDEATAWRLRGRSVTLQRRTSSGWREVATGPLSGNGYASFTVKPAASIAYRLTFGAREPFAASVSAVRSINVRAWPRYAPARAAGSSRITTGSPSGSTSVSTKVLAPASSRAATVVAVAAAQSGKRYLFGAAGPDAFDCSGLTRYVFGKVGVHLPHLADAQKNYGVAVSRAAARPGDLVVFLSGGYAYHVGIYAGGGYLYDAPQPGQTVGKDRIWGSNVVFRRLV